MQNNLKEKKMLLNHKLKKIEGLPQIDLEFLEEDFDKYEGYVEFYIGGLPDDYLDSNGEEQENIPCIKVKVEYNDEELEYAETVFEQDHDELSDEEFMEQSQLDPDSVKLLKNQVQKYVKRYVLNNLDEINRNVAEAYGY